MPDSAIQPYAIEPIATNLPTDSVLIAALLSSVIEHRNLLQGRRIWLACSGGRDSLALAALCLQLYRQGKLPFLPQLLHVNHGLQSASKQWAQHVGKWAAAQQMPCTILHAQVKGHDEQAARQARYQVMRAHINQGDVLLLAHHADDQAETVLMRLIQGAGVKGLSAMQAWRVQTQGAQHNILWRPWLIVRRTTITTYAKHLKLPYINDPTNDSGDNVRSGLRAHIMPELAIYNHNVIANITRSAQLLSDAQATVSAVAAQDLQTTAIQSLCQPPAQRVLDIDQLQALPHYRQRQLLHYWLAQDEPLPPSKQLIDDVGYLLERLDNNHYTQLDWHAKQQTYRICRYRQQLYRLSQTWLDWLMVPIIEHQAPLNDVSTSLPHTIYLRHNQKTHWQIDITADALSTFFDDKKTMPITLKIAPLGRQQRIKTSLATRPQSGKKLFQTLGIPVWLRDSLVMVSLISDNFEQPLWLLSPFACWRLTRDREGFMSDNTLTAITPDMLILKNRLLILSDSPLFCLSDAALP